MAIEWPAIIAPAAVVSALVAIGAFTYAIRNARKQVKRAKRGRSEQTSVSLVHTTKKTYARLKAKGIGRMSRSRIGAGMLFA